MQVVDQDRRLAGDDRAVEVGVALDVGLVAACAGPDRELFRHAGVVAADHLTLMDKSAPQRRYELREVFNALRWMARAGAAWLGA